MAHIYVSPLRPPDAGYVARQAGVEVDWDNTEIGEWHPKQRFAFTGPIPAQLASQLTLESVCALCKMEVAEVNYRGWCGECFRAMTEDEEE